MYFSLVEFTLFFIRSNYHLWFEVIGQRFDANAIQNFQIHFFGMEYNYFIFSVGTKKKEITINNLVEIIYYNGLLDVNI